jgi:hypothetical protein
MQQGMRGGHPPLVTARDMPDSDALYLGLVTKRGSYTRQQREVGGEAKRKVM